EQYKVKHHKYFFLYFLMHYNLLVCIIPYQLYMWKVHHYEVYCQYVNLDELNYSHEFHKALLQ
ncbi:hypothetical protein C1645_789710, partial [Glomus cerebriforme]